MTSAKQPTFTTTEAAEIIGVAAATVRTWFQRKWLRKPYPESEGQWRVLGVDDVLRLAIFKAMVDDGEDPQEVGRIVEFLMPGLFDEKSILGYAVDWEGNWLNGTQFLSGVTPEDLGYHLAYHASSGQSERTKRVKLLYLAKIKNDLIEKVWPPRPRTGATGEGQFDKREESE